MFIAYMKTFKYLLRMKGKITMKIMLREIAVLTIVATMFAYPSVNVYAYVERATYYYEDAVNQYKYFSFENGERFIANHYYRLENNVNNGNWYVEAGHTIFFAVSYALQDNYELVLYDTMTGQTLIDYYAYTNGMVVSSMPVPHSGNYMIIVRSLGNDAWLQNYCVDID